MTTKVPRWRRSAVLSLLLAAPIPAQANDVLDLLAGAAALVPSIGAGAVSAAVCTVTGGAYSPFVRGAGLGSGHDAYDDKFYYPKAVPGIGMLIGGYESLIADYVSSAGGPDSRSLYLDDEARVEKNRYARPGAIRPPVAALEKYVYEKIIPKGDSSVPAQLAGGLLMPIPLAIAGQVENVAVGALECGAAGGLQSFRQLKSWMTGSSEPVVGPGRRTMLESVRKFGRDFQAAKWEHGPLFQPTRYALEDEELQDSKYRTLSAVNLKAADGSNVHGWLSASRKPNGLWIVFFHGNAGSLPDRYPQIEAMSAMGFNVLAIDYRGYGASEGYAGEEALYQDGQSALDFVLGLGVHPTDIVLMGGSLGAAVAIDVASKNDLPFAALVIGSPFSNVPEMAEFMGGQKMLVLGFLKDHVRPRFDNVAKIPGIRVPMYFELNEYDPHIPYSLQKRVAEAAAAEKHVRVIDDLPEHTEFTPKIFGDLKRIASTRNVRLSSLP